MDNYFSREVGVRWLERKIKDGDGDRMSAERLGRNLLGECKGERLDEVGGFCSLGGVGFRREFENRLIKGVVSLLSTLR